MGTQCRNPELLWLHGYNSETCWYLILLCNHFLCFLALTFFRLSLQHYSLSLRGDYVWFWGLIRKLFSASYAARNLCINYCSLEREAWLRFAREYKNKYWEAILVLCRFSWTTVFSFHLRVYIIPREILLFACLLFICSIGQKALILNNLLRKIGYVLFFWGGIFLFLQNSYVRT